MLTFIFQYFQKFWSKNVYALFRKINQLGSAKFCNYATILMKFSDFSSKFGTIGL